MHTDRKLTNHTRQGERDREKRSEGGGEGEKMGEIYSRWDHMQAKQKVFFSTEGGVSSIEGITEVIPLWKTTDNFIQLSKNKIQAGYSHQHPAGFQFSAFKEVFVGECCHVFLLMNPL